MKKINSAVIVFMSLLWIACDPGSKTVELGDPTTCEGCHTSRETLELYAEGDSSGGSGGG